jgi:hypothetical protein
MIPMPFVQQEKRRKERLTESNYLKEPFFFPHHPAKPPTMNWET